jgi:hypothetical protein
MEKPMYEVLGTITLPVYKLPDGVYPPAFDVDKTDLVKQQGVYVDLSSKYNAQVTLPEKAVMVKRGEHTNCEFDPKELLKHIDGSCSATCEAVKSELEIAVSRLLEKATAEELISLRNAKLI